MNHRVVWIVAVVVAVGVLGAFGFSIVTFEPGHHGPVEVTSKAPESGPKAIAGGR